MGKSCMISDFFVLFLLCQTFQNGTFLVIDMNTDGRSGFGLIMLFQCPSNGVMLVDQSLMRPLILRYSIR